MNEIKKITDKQLRCLKYIEDHKILTPGDEENYKGLFMMADIISKQNLNAFQAKTIIQDFVEMTEKHKFPCFRKFEKEYFISKVYKRLFAEIGEEETCNHFCPFGSNTDECTFFQSEDKK